jgi:AcrR family transcriptional regulator
MAGAETVTGISARRPQRADARRNYEKLLSAAREAFAEDSSVTLEEIARRAQVGIGTLYRHFPTRPDLLESVYVVAVEELCGTARELADMPPWEALVAWLHRYVGYVGTKRALAEELSASLGRDSEVFRGCRESIFTEAGPLLTRAQEAGVARTDATFDDVLRLVSGITMMTFKDEGQMEKVLDMALDGLRTR